MGDREKARALVLRKLARREYSRLEIRRALEGKGFSADDIEEVIRELSEKRYLSEERFKKAFVSDQLLKGKGPRLIQMKLRQKGVLAETEEISEISKERTGKSEIQRAIEIVKRRYPMSLSDEKEARRAYQALIRRGFSFETAREAVFGESKDKDNEA